MEYYRYIMALHVIFVVSWFAALFYMPRLLIYHAEADQKPEPDRGILSEQLKIMQKRLWGIIAWPALLLTWAMGLWMMYLNPSLLSQPWFILKLLFVSGLTLYHVQTHALYMKHQRDEIPWTSFKLRLWNEVATIFLFAIVFLVIPKQNTGWVWATLGLIGFAAAMFAAVSIYRKAREKKKEEPDA
ncbi:MAG TPA: CopD family protein [Bacteroidia bacterium]|nr:CopD family protein [Bacteroidia bacterium]